MNGETPRLQSDLKAGYRDENVDDEGEDGLMVQTLTPETMHQIASAAVVTTSNKTGSTYADADLPLAGAADDENGASSGLFCDVEAEARLVVEAITENRPHARSRSASADDGLEDDRSASIEILDDRTLEEEEFNSPNSCVNTLERNKRLKGVSPSIVDINYGEDDEVEEFGGCTGEDNQQPVVKTGPRICKPVMTSEAPSEEETKAVRGRRKGLYSPAKKPPVPAPLTHPVATHSTANKPAVAPKPRGIAAKSPTPQVFVYQRIELLLTSLKSCLSKSNSFFNFQTI